MKFLHYENQSENNDCILSIKTKLENLNARKIKMSYDNNYY